MVLKRQIALPGFNRTKAIEKKSLSLQSWIWISTQ